MINISQVLAWKFTGIDWRVEGTVDNPLGEIVRFEGGIPSKVDQSAWTAEYEAHVQANAYKSERLAEYAKLNQYEMMFDDQRDSTTTWVDAVNAIKAQFPKPS